MIHKGEQSKHKAVKQSLAFCDWRFALDPILAQSPLGMSTNVMLPKLPARLGTPSGRKPHRSWGNPSIATKHPPLVCLLMSDHLHFLPQGPNLSRSHQLVLSTLWKVTKAQVLPCIVSIFTYIWVILRVSVDKCTMHGYLSSV